MMLLDTKEVQVAKSASEAISIYVTGSAISIAKTQGGFVIELGPGLGHLSPSTPATRN
jgi:hypothetical protein